MKENDMNQTYSLLSSEDFDEDLLGDSNDTSNGRMLYVSVHNETQEMSSTNSSPIIAGDNGLRRSFEPYTQRYPVERRVLFPNDMETSEEKTERAYLQETSGQLCETCKRPKAATFKESPPKLQRLFCQNNCATQEQPIEFRESDNVPKATPTGQIYGIQARDLKSKYQSRTFELCQEARSLIGMIEMANRLNSLEFDVNPDGEPNWSWKTTFSKTTAGNFANPTLVNLTAGIICMTSGLFAQVVLTGSDASLKNTPRSSNTRNARRNIMQSRFDAMIKGLNIGWNNTTTTKTDKSTSVRYLTVKDNPEGPWTPTIPEWSEWVENDAFDAFTGDWKKWKETWEHSVLNKLPSHYHSIGASVASTPKTKLLIVPVAKYLLGKLMAEIQNDTNLRLEGKRPPPLMYVNLPFKFRCHPLKSPR